MCPRPVTGLPFSILFWLASTVPAAAQQPAHPHWTYEGEGGPTHWASLDPAYEACGIGQHQSPIDIRGAKPAPLPAIKFSYQPSPLRIVDNGHTVQMNYAPGSFITVGDQKYELQQFHFHHPAEERVNGRSYPMVAHLVHKSADGKIAVVAVLLTEGHANPFVEKLWKHLPAEQGHELALDTVMVDAGHLLPPRSDYYTYTGSLTAPPCTEGVTWFALKTPVQLSKDDVAVFAKRYPHNARPVQPLNGRQVQMTQ
ncbi:MAG TPA: carbonic anhydrase family protein [Anaeromyxobacteraceae bacterium]|nr:carbonic anhydrase family protein [Anaeromyxobacteraceae bacterium]